VLECVINVSEGHDGPTLQAIAAAGGPALLDLHHDEHHNRAVLTLAGDDVEATARAVASAAVERLDLRSHTGAHPRIGVVDVVPFVPLGVPMAEAVGARDRFAEWMSNALGVRCFLYGPERSLPEARREAAAAPASHPTAGHCAVGARTVLVAYNLWLAQPDLERAQAIAAAIRSPAVRALGFAVGEEVQVSCNLVEPLEVGPAAIFDRVAALAPIDRAELVGLAPLAVVQAAPRTRWLELDLAEDSTIEARLALRR